MTLAPSPFDFGSSLDRVQATPQRSAEDVLQVLDALKLDHPVLAGHSFGGLDLLTTQAQHPTLAADLECYCVINAELHKKDNWKVAEEGHDERQFPGGSFTRRSPTPFPAHCYANHEVEIR